MIHQIHGLIISLHSQKSKAGNEFFELNVKVSESEISVVRIMKYANSNITGTYSTDIHSTFIFFFNSYRSIQYRIQQSNQLNFTYTNDEKITVESLKNQTTRAFDVKGYIKCVVVIKPGFLEKLSYLMRRVIYLLLSGRNILKMLNSISGIIFFFK